MAYRACNGIWLNCTELASNWTMSPFRFAAELVGVEAAAD
jgi:hypothetical protein